MRGLPWLLCLLLALTGLLQLRLLLQPGTGFSTMPLLVPLSLEHEAAMRQGGPPALDRAQVEALLAELQATPPDPALAARIQAFADTRAELLALRNRRHQLNVSLMQTGVGVARVLGPEQWEHLLSHRDAVQAEAEAELLDRVLQELR